MPTYWYQNNLRFLQTVLREPDIIDYNPRETVAYMEEVNANCLVVNAGGVIDFFDYPREMANRNQFFQRDILKELCDEIHRAGLRVIVRVDFRGVEQRRLDLHPDWFARDRQGNPKPANYGGTKIYQPCYHSYYANEHAEQFISYILSHYEVDGIWQNSLGFDSSPCYCDACRRSFREEFGEEIPVVPAGVELLEALESPEFENYRAWKIVHCDRHIERMRRATKRYGEEKAYCAEIFDLYSDHFSKTTGISHANARKSFDFIVSCVFLSASHSQVENRVYDIISNSATTIRFSRALAPEKQPVIVTGGNGTRWRYVADPALENRLWMWEIASVGGGIWNCYFNGQNPSKTHDRRNAYSERDVYTYLADNAEALGNSRPVMDVGIYYSRYTQEKDCSADERLDRFGVHIKGVERVLLENHIQYGFLPDSQFSSQALEGVKALLLPNCTRMPDRDLEIIREYVKNGGGLIASHTTSILDEAGNPRGDFGLADLFGVHDTGVRMDTAADTYQLIRDRESPVLQNIGDTDVLMSGGRTVLCSPGEADTVATHIPTIPNQPPEHAWVPDMRTEYPTIVTNRYGRGRVVYFAGTTDALCFLNGHEDFTEVYKNALDYVSGGEYSLRAEAPRSVHINAVESVDCPGRLVVSLVNTTGTSQRPLKEVLPVRDVIIQLPLGGRRLERSAVLWGEKVEVASWDGSACIEIESLDEFAGVELLLR